MNEELRAFSKIPKELFYINNTKEGYKTSILNNIKDDKIVLILHYLYTLGNRYNITAVTIDYLLSKCNYCINNNNKRDVKTILEHLKTIKLIDYAKIKDSNMIIEIDINNLINSNNFVTLEQREIKLLECNTTNKKELLNLVKIYLYIKSRAFNRNDTYDLEVTGGRTQTTYCSYDNISIHTRVGQGQIKKYIDKLQEIKLIKYDNLGMKSIEINKRTIIDECINLYAITNLCKNIDYELKEGLKQQEYNYINKGYKIIKVKANNKNITRAINGRKGYLTKKLNNNTLTNKEVRELELINTDIEKYKKLYISKQRSK